MRVTQTFGMIVGLALGLASTVSAQPSGPAPLLGWEAMGKESLVLDFSKFPMEKFVKDGETNNLWQSLAGRQVFDGLPFLLEGRMCVYGKKMGPEKPFFTSVGRFPEWSMWACETTTASIEEAGNGKLRFLRSASLRRPWCSPQSSRKRRPPDSTRCMEPVTSPAAPQNVSFICRPPEGSW